MAYLLPAVLFLSGWYLILTDCFPIPDRKARKALSGYADRKTDLSALVRQLETIGAGTAKLLLPLVRLSDLRRIRLSLALRDLGDPRSPEEYTAEVVSLTCLLAVSGFPFLFFAPLIFALFLLAAAYYAFRTEKTLKTASRSKSMEIERELPRFAAYIRQTLLNNRNALLLLERYRTDNTVFAGDVEKTVADARTSSFTSALLRWSSRYNSEHLSMIVHGLIGISNGDDVRSYFELLERDFREIELNRLRREIKKIPKRMRKSMLVVYSAIALLYFTPILILIIENIRKFFS